MEEIHQLSPSVQGATRRLVAMSKDSCLSITLAFSGSRDNVGYYSLKPSSKSLIDLFSIATLLLQGLEK